MSSNFSCLEIASSLKTGPFASPVSAVRNHRRTFTDGYGTPLRSHDQKSLHQSISYKPRTRPDATRSKHTTYNKAPQALFHRHVMPCPSNMIDWP